MTQEELADQAGLSARYVGAIERADVSASVTVLGQIADALMEHMQAKGAIVMIEAEHMCMTMRGIKKPGSQTVTLARRGVFETDPALEERFFRMLER